MTDHKAEWVLVPREPTQEWRDTVANLLHIGDAEMDSIHAALLAAAPVASEGEDVAKTYRCERARVVGFWNHDCAECLQRIAENTIGTRPAAQVAATDGLGDDKPVSIGGVTIKPCGPNAHVSVETEGGGRVACLAQPSYEVGANVLWEAARAIYKHCAQVAATPKHDEGRDLFDAAYEAAHESKQGKKGICRYWWNAALATQPAARRVTEQDVERAAQAIADVVGHRMAEKCEAQARAALESFAQPAEGVSGVG